MQQKSTANFLKLLSPPGDYKYRHLGCGFSAPKNTPYWFRKEINDPEEMALIDSAIASGREA